MRLLPPTALGLVVFLAAPAAAQVIGGRAIRVSTQPLGSLLAGFPVTSVATTIDGGLVVAWNDRRLGVEQPFVQRFDRWGHRRGDEIAVPGTPRYTQVAAVTGGGFVVVWSDASGGIHGRCYDGDGAPGAALTIGTGRVPDVGNDDQGNFVVTWSETGSGTQVFAQRYSSLCVALGPAIVVTNTAAPGPLAQAALAVGPDGRFLVSWDQPLGVIFGRRYAPDGSPVGGATQLSDVQAGPHHRASVAADGSFVVAWGGFPLSARRFDAAGNALGASFPVGAGSEPRVVHTASGAFVVFWQGGVSPQFLVQLRWFSAGGSGGPTLQAGDDVRSGAFFALAAQPDGVVAANWIRKEGPQDEVVLRRFGPVMPQGYAADGNGILEPGEDVNAITSWTNGTGAPASLSGTSFSGGFTGPLGAGVTYSLIDPTSNYGTIPDGASASCIDCLRIGVSAPPARPVRHWDGLLDEVAVWLTGSLRHRWRVHVGESFTDVSAASGFYPFVETLLHADVTAGCAAAEYCPASPVTREQMAVFVLRSRHEAYQSAACAGSTRRFDDVPASSPFCRWIEDLARRSVVGGCGGGRYCPQSPVSRQEMAVFVLATKEAPGYAPPACGTPMFADVPASSPFCPWIEELARRGVVTGCGGGSYCPAAPVSREQMAVFLSVTFGLSLGTP
jgi:S-layer family protein